MRLTGEERQRHAAGDDRERPQLHGTPLGPAQRSRSSVEVEPLRTQSPQPDDERRGKGSKHGHRQDAVVSRDVEHSCTTQRSLNAARMAGSSPHEREPVMSSAWENSTGIVPGIIATFVVR